MVCCLLVIRMRNIPLFTTEFGVASLVLEKIPYSGQAYIVIQNTNEPDRLLQECVAFCHTAGAVSVYATGAAFLEKHPLYTTVIAMSRSLIGLPLTDAVLIQVQKESLSDWRELYNEKMRNVPNAAFLTIRDSEKLLQEGNCYYIYKNNALIGIGVAENGAIKAIASVVPGGGKDAVLALCGALHSDTVSLEVAANNIPAVKLYTSLGFAEIGTISRWYQIN